MKFYLISLCSFMLFINCQYETSQEKVNPRFAEDVSKIKFEDFNRDSIKARISKKIKSKEPLIAHVLVPLCDNENQGIVPVSASLGDGLNLKTNLYWGALYGLKTHFKKLADWRLIYAEKDISNNILERVVFEKTFHNGAIVKLVLDAYRGDKMEECLEDYFLSLAGRKQNFLALENQKIGIHGNADLIGFNGHNGLMDYQVEPVVNIDGRKKDAVVIGCISFDYFKNHLKIGGGYPLLTTNNLMAPEAYVLAGALDAWATLKSEEEVREAAAVAYDLYQKCGIKGARNLFKN